MNIVISGANRGIGLELCRQYLARGDSVWAGARNPEASPELRGLAGDGAPLRIAALDVADEVSVRAFAAGIAAPIDLLINNAGVKGTERSFEDEDWTAALRIFDVNALGALRLTRALLPRLRDAARPKVVQLSSLLGSIAENRAGGLYGYRMSKAAMNMASRSMAQDLDLISVAMSPGWVKTDMGGHAAPLAVDASVRSMIGFIERLSDEDSGGFFDNQGKPLPW
jgi:NAD(P)-dependent dehydrogenase (short-subunit alcohol dehydrogenase family)